MCPSESPHCLVAAAAALVFRVVLVDRVAGAAEDDEDDGTASSGTFAFIVDRLRRYGEPCSVYTTT